MHSERVRYIMTESVLSVGVHESVAEVMRLFANYPIHHLPVVDGSELRGMLSSADMLKLEYFLPTSSARTLPSLWTDKFKIASMMRQPAITAMPNDTIADAASRMATHGIHSLPVVDERNHLIGIVTTTDIMHALLSGETRKVESEDSNQKPVELESLHSIRAAKSAIRNGKDENGIAASLLYLYKRNVLLEQVREDTARYLQSGQSALLHTRLLVEINSLTPNADLPIRL